MRLFNIQKQVTSKCKPQTHVHTMVVSLTVQQSSNHGLMLHLHQANRSAIPISSPMSASESMGRERSLIMTS